MRGLVEMKKIINIMFIITLLFLFIPNVYANNALKIESIELDSKSDSTEIINDLSFNDLSINYDVQFKNLGDYAKYKVIINNNSNDDYELGDSSNNSQYINYIYDFDDGNNIIEKNKKSTMYLTIKYDKQIPLEKLNESDYTENNNSAVSLNYHVKNPKTMDNNKSMILFVLIVLTLYFIMKKLDNLSFEYLDKKNINYN